MKTPTLEAEYEQLVKENLAAAPAPTGGAERREHPRLKVDPTQFTIPSAPQMSVLDVSLSAIALHSNHPFAPGEEVRITLANGFSVEARVRSCELEETGPGADLLDTPFRVVCQFHELHEGMELIVTAKRAGT